ncbi:MAG: hypothetical protein P8N49_04500 [Opitutales bacterium]|nr:hypothetical protein [Opitutales bacterium]
MDVSIPDNKRWLNSLHSTHLQKISSPKAEKEFLWIILESDSLDDNGIKVAPSFSGACSVNAMGIEKQVIVSIKSSSDSNSDFNFSSFIFAVNLGCISITIADKPFVSFKNDNSSHLFIDYINKKFVFFRFPFGCTKYFKKDDKNFSCLLHCYLNMLDIPFLPKEKD